MAVDQGLAMRVREAITEQALQRGLALREKRMFGGLAFMLNDEMACGVISDDMMVRVGPAAYDDALAHEHARPMDFTGKPMRGYIFIAARGCHTQTSVTYWVDRAATNMHSLIRAAPKSTARG
jgi:TfoX/Sxy family transcriptional regulator of competence genes